MNGGRPSSGGSQGLREPRPPVIRYAACADSGLDPDDWFPASRDPAVARVEAAAALAVCGACLARKRCLELSLRHWPLGQYGIWGGTLPGERKALLREHLAASSRQLNRATS